MESQFGSHQGKYFRSASMKWCGPIEGPAGWVVESSLLIQHSAPMLGRPCAPSLRVCLRGAKLLTVSILHLEISAHYGAFPLETVPVLHSGAAGQVVHRYLGNHED